MHALLSANGTPHRNSRYTRVVMFFVLIFLALQLLGANAHAHAYGEDHSNNCAACLIADMPLGSPPPPVTVAPVASLLVFTLPAPARDTPVRRTGYLTPPSHAPPAVAAVFFPLI